MKKFAVVLFCLGASVATAQAPKTETRVEVKIVTEDNARGTEIKREVEQTLRLLGLHVGRGQTTVTYGPEEKPVTEDFVVWVEGR